MDQATKRQRADHCCSICGITCTRNSTLLRHQRSASHLQKVACCDTPIFACPYECGYTSGRQDTIQRHLEEVHFKRRRHAKAATPSTSSTALVSPQQPGEQDENAPYRPGDAAVNQSCGVTTPDESDYSLSSIPHVEQAAEEDAFWWNRLDFECDLDTAFGLSHEPGASHSSSADDFDAVMVMADGTLERSESIAESSKTTPNCGSLPPPIVKRERGSYLRLCTLCHQRFGKTHAEVKQHMDRHMQELSGSHKHRCETCDIGFIHDQDFLLHMQVSQSGNDCGFHFEHESPCTGHHPQSEAIDRKGFENKLRDWELSQHMRYRMQIDDCAEKGGTTHVPAYGSSKLAYCRSLGSLKSLRTRFTKFSTPTDVDYHALANPKGKHVTGPTRLLKTGLDTVRSHVARRGSLAQLNEEFPRRSLKDQVISAMRECDKEFMIALLQSDENTTYEHDGAGRTTWSLFELLDRCDDMESGFNPDFKIGDVFPVVDLLVKHGRVTPAEAAELAAGNDYGIFLRYIRSGVRVDVSRTLIQDAFCKAILYGDSDVVAALLAQGADSLLVEVAQMECFNTMEPTRDKGRAITFQGLDHHALATALVSNGKKASHLLKKVAYNPCAEAVAYEVKHEACDKCADHYRLKHHSFQKFNAGHSHRLYLLSRACGIDQLKVRLARCFLPRIARAALRELHAKDA